MNIKTIDLKIISLLQRWFMPMARVAIFIVYFYFGVLKLAGFSPATPLASILTARTIGLGYFDLSFKILAILECVIGILFLIPKATRVVIPLLIVHLAVVCSPLLLVPSEVWTRPFVPTLEGQYIIKNVLIVAVTIGIAAQTRPLKRK